MKWSDIFSALKRNNMFKIDPDIGANNNIRAGSFVRISNYWADSHDFRCRGVGLVIEDSKYNFLVFSRFRTRNWYVFNGWGTQYIYRESMKPLNTKDFIDLEIDFDGSEWYDVVQWGVRKDVFNDLA